MYLYVYKINFFNFVENLEKIYNFQLKGNTCIHCKYLVIGFKKMIVLYL